VADDKPLHVRVAEALHPELATWQATAKPDEMTGGMVFLGDREWSEPGEWLHVTHDTARRVPRYDTDWSATGPLIERLGIGVYQFGDGWEAVKPQPVGGAYAEQERTPLLAVCALILALSETGKLPQ
jgi:hypothetical protein